MFNTELFVRKLGGFAIASTALTWMRTLDFQGAYYDTTVDPGRDDFRGPVIMLLWHEYLLFPFYLRGHTNTAILVSQHRDAEWLNQAARHSGFRVIRGSTNRGGTAALREIVDVGKSNMNVAITPDGPRGPRRTLAAGPIFLASRLGIPLVACGMGYDRPWRLKTWDRFAIPRPFSRARGIASPRLEIPPKLDRDGIEYYRARTESLLNLLCDEAEDWAETGAKRENSFPLVRRAMSQREAGVAFGDVVEEMRDTKFVEPAKATKSVRRAA